MGRTVTEDGETREFSSGLKTRHFLAVELREARLCFFFLTLVEGPWLDPVAENVKLDNLLTASSTALPMDLGLLAAKLSLLPGGTNVLLPLEPGIAAVNPNVLLPLVPGIAAVKSNVLMPLDPGMAAVAGAPDVLAATSTWLPGDLGTVGVKSTLLPGDMSIVDVKSTLLSWNPDVLETKSTLLPDGDMTVKSSLLPRASGFFSSMDTSAARLDIIFLR